ncbi:MAG: sporulation protein YqfD [Lachnospiraceae bacterium]|nr:sporulation protein YqfD [Lachnospiraceae bacterium]
MIGFLKWVRGYVQIKVWGFAPERFLNLCSNKNILLWDIKKDGDIYYLCISLAGFYRLKEITRKTGTRVVILKRCGLPFLVPQILSRKVFVLGLFAACFFWFWSSRYIWEINITGNTIITEDVFIDFLKEHGIRVGMQSDDLDIEELEKEIRREFQEITWTSAKLSGTSLEISVKENDALLAPMQEDILSDLYAEKDGLIVSMIVRSGVPQVKIGDRVEEGTLLVDGRVPVYNEDTTVRKYQCVRSDADIYVQRIQEVYEELPFYYMDKVYTGREQESHYMKLFGKMLEVGGSCSFTVYDTVITEKEFEPLKGLTLPFILGTRCYREYQNTERIYTTDQAKELLIKKYSAFISGLEEKGVQIIEKDVKIETGSDRWILVGKLQVIEKIGTEVPFTEESIVEEGTVIPESIESE